MTSSALGTEEEDCSASAADALMASYDSPGLAVLTVVASVTKDEARAVCTGLSSESFPPGLLDLGAVGAKLTAAAGAASALGACLRRPDCCRAETAAEAEDSSSQCSVEPSA